ncbi:MAG: hypothetical protein ACR2H1_09805 [Limisphaerales bacterium]
MNCFYHPQTVAVGICKNCAKGLCLDCATDLKDGLACKNRCEGEVTNLLSMIRKNKKAYAGASDIQFRSGVFWSILGVISILSGLNSKTPDAFAFSDLLF